MREIQINCPHCGSLQGARFACIVPAETPGDSFTKVSAFAICNRCEMGVVIFAKMATEGQYNGSGQPLDLSKVKSEAWERASVWSIAPAPPKPRTVGALPPQAGKAFLDGEEELTRRKYRSAVGSYRTALERALRAIDPDLESRLSEGGKKRVTLNNRIQAIQKEKLLPPALVDLANRVRAFGNEIHEDEDPDEDQARLASDCAHLLLVYLFELPAMVAAAQARQSGNTQSPGHAASP